MDGRIRRNLYAQKIANQAFIQKLLNLAIWVIVIERRHFVPLKRNPRSADLPAAA